MQSMEGEEQASALFIGKPVFDEREIQVFVATVEFVADNGMSDVGQVNPDLVFAAGVRHDAKQSERPVEPTFDPILRLCRRAIEADAVLNRHAAVLIFTKRSVDEAVLLVDSPVHDGQVIFRDITALE